MKPINIVHLYPKEMNIYGDNGNILVLHKRLEWRGIPAKVIKVGVGDEIPVDAHIIVGGGGQDAGQSTIAVDLQTKAAKLKDLSEAGVPMLMICGMYQMFGHFFKTQDGLIISGIGILDIETIAGKGRLIGNISSRSKWGNLVGYENHSGLTYLGSKTESFGLTSRGMGNNGKDRTEGARQNNVFGSYLHGPLLAKSPQLADFLLVAATKAAGLENDLATIECSLEELAAKTAARRPR